MTHVQANTYNNKNNNDFIYHYLHLVLRTTTNTSDASSPGNKRTNSRRGETTASNTHRIKQPRKGNGSSPRSQHGPCTFQPPCLQLGFHVHACA